MKTSFAVFRMFSVLLLVGAVGLQANGSSLFQQASGMSDLGPDPLIYIPESMKDLLARSSTAVRAHVVAFDGVRWQDGPPLRKDRNVPNRMAFATYTVEIDEVLYVATNSTPGLTTGQQLKASDRLGRASFEKVQKGQVPVRPGEECLLFLYHQPGVDGWMLAPWEVQYRKTDGAPAGAEAIKPGFEQHTLGTVLAQSQGEKTFVLWDKLLDEVRTTAKVAQR